MSQLISCLFRSVPVFLLGALLATVASGQSRSGSAHIVVEPKGAACVYQIQDQTDQDLLIVAPDSAVTVEARRGLWVDVSVEDDPRGVPATRNLRALSLRSDQGRGSLVARSAIGRSTEHRLHIQCCTERAEGRGCPRWMDAQPPSMNTGALRDVPVLPPDIGGAARGPSALLPLPRPSEMPPGGPVMRVEEQ